MSTRLERTQSIDRYEQEFDGATGIYMTDINGVAVGKITKFRADLRNVDVRYLVVKNSLARIALERCGLDPLASYLKGSLGVAITKTNGVAPAKIIKEFHKANKDLLDVRVAYVDGKIFNADEVARLADLPSKDVLLSQFLSCLQAPMSNFVGLLGGFMSSLVGTLEAVKDKKETEI